MALNARATKVASRVVLALFVVIDTALGQYFASLRLNAFLVGASLLAMGVNDDAGLLGQRGAFKSIASKLAPTGEAAGL